MTLSPEQMAEWESLELSSWQKSLIDATQRGEVERIAYVKKMIEGLEDTNKV